MDFSSNIFQQVTSIPESARIVFVADYFASEVTGGAELTSEALIQSSPYEVFKLHSRDVTMSLIESARSKFWIFGNFSHLNPQLIPTIVGNLQYSILEYDYKYCKYRSPEKHFSVAGLPCDCHNQLNGKVISAFYYASTHMWWMSEKQKERYFTLFPFLSERNNTVLSSVFDGDTLGKIKILRDSISQEDRSGWIVFKSDSWIKGTTQALEWVKSMNLDYELISNLSYSDMLAKLASAEGLVYLPPGGDTCPRMVIEAKLLGCKLKLNENVQHKDEEWFATSNLNETEDYLAAAPNLFWNVTRNTINHKPKISGYLTTFNCVKQDYPFIDCIRSMMNFCNEVCVVDGGSTDDTLQQLRSLQREFEENPDSTGDLDDTGFSRTSRLKVKIIERDWNHPRSAVFDGMQKAEARKMCTGEFCWQMDSDEIVHQDDASKVIELCRKLPKGLNIISLPVIEYWGSHDKVRVDIQPWKWRLSRNLPHITHGIPAELRRVDEQGHTYSAPGSDGCDMIHSETGERLQHASFYTADIETIRRQALLGDATALQQYEQWFNHAVSELPSVFHYSWLNLERKIKLYRDFWTRHWEVLNGKGYSDTSESNMMFDCAWSEVTEEMIVSRAKELSTIGGWIWHSKWNGQKTPWIKVNRKSPL